MAASDWLQLTTEPGRKIQKNDPNISKDIQDIQSKYKIQSGSRPGPSQGPRGPGPARARPLAWAGPAAAWYFVFTSYILYILYIFGYIWIIFLKLYDHRANLFSFSVFNTESIGRCHMYILYMYKYDYTRKAILFPPAYDPSTFKMFRAIPPRFHRQEIASCMVGCSNPDFLKFRLQLKGFVFPHFLMFFLQTFCKCTCFYIDLN